MQYHDDIESRFSSCLETDKDAHVKRWMASWAYQDRRSKLGASYREELPQDFMGYNGPSDLVKWLNWMIESDAPDYLDDETVVPLVELSKAQDEKILEAHSLSFDMKDYSSTIGRYNAQDFIFQNFYPVPKRYSVHRILDFGAGYGRQANLWTQKVDDLVFVAMDAIPLSYCLQHLYYSHLPAPSHDYVVEPASFSIRGEPGIYHLPTWRHDLLPTEFFDMVVCAQVLQEINARLLRLMIDVFARVLKPGGCVYIRDHGVDWQPVHKVDLNRLLPQKGFELEFRPHVVDLLEIHGVPRIWRKRDPRVVEKRSQASTKPLVERVLDADMRLGGVATRVYRALRTRRSSGRR